MHGMEGGLVAWRYRLGGGCGEGGGLSVQEKSVRACMEAMLAEGQWPSLSVDQFPEEQPS